MKLDRHDFVSVVMLLIVGVYEVIPVAEPKRLSLDRHEHELVRDSFHFKHKLFSQRSVANIQTISILVMPV